MAVILLIPWFRLEPQRVELPLVGERTIEPFTVAAVLALFVALLVAVVFAKRNRRSIDQTLNLALYLVVFGLPISYLANGVFYAPKLLAGLLDHPSEFFDVSLGWSMYGGVLGGIAGAWVWKWRTGGSLFETLDCLAFGAPFGWTIARLGCFVAHDHPGKVSNFLLAVADYEVGAPPYQPRHDLGLYDAFVLAGIAVTFVVLGRKPHRPGFYIALLALLYAPCRFLLDFLRAPASEGGDLRCVGLTPAQYGSVLLVIAGVVVLRRVRNAR